MRFFRDLSVARKLAAGAVLGMALLGALVALVAREGGIAGGEQAAERRAVAAQGAAGASERHLLAVTNGWRGMLIYNQPEAIRRELANLEANVERLRGSLEQARNLSDSEAAREALGVAGSQAEALREAYARAAQARLAIVAKRDGDFFPRIPEFDQALEAAHANVQFGMQGEAQEAMRDILTTYVQAINEVRMGLQRYLATDDAAAASRVRRSAAQARVHARRMLAAAEASVRADIRRLGEAGEAMAAPAEAILGLLNELNELRPRLVTARGEAEAALAAAEAALVADARGREASAAAAMASVQRTVWSIGFVVMLIMVASAWLTSRAVGSPLGRLSAAVRRISGGDTAAAVPDQDRKDEIGQIAVALEGLRGGVRQAFAQQQMLAQMNVGVMMADPGDELRITYANPEMVRVMEAVQDALPVKAAELVGRGLDIFPPEVGAGLGDARGLPRRARIGIGGELLDLQVSAIMDRDGGYAGPMLLWSNATAKARLADDFESEVGGVVEAVAGAAGQMQQAAHELSGAADSSGREADAVAEVSGRAGAEVQAVAASAEELAASVAEITRQVAEGAQVARAAAEEARATDGTVQGLAQAASRIGDVVRLISSIAGQTNLLALNATIEAARAGEAGKGFAVVASEVKNLAAQTAKATEEIATQVSGIQGSTEQAVSALQNITATIERMNEVTTAIAAAVEEQGAATREIARSAALVADGTGTVTRRIEDVRQASGETGRSAAQMLVSSGEMARQAGALKEKANGFLRQIRAA